MKLISLFSGCGGLDLGFEKAGFEPRLIEDDGDELTLEFQKDGKGAEGDVRDIVIKRDDIEWEIGLSIKHRHEDAKHS